jgi:hypothetical protein
MDPPTLPAILYRHAVLAGETLADDLGVLVDQDGHEKSLSACP